MAYRFAEAGIKAAHIDGETSAYERQRIIDDFRAGNIKILCNVDLISEGFDVPDCSCVIMLRPTQSLVLYTQQSMRCMRYQPHKRAVIIDHVGNYTRFGMPDADRAWKLDAVKGDKVSGAETLKLTQCPMKETAEHVRRADITILLLRRNERKSTLRKIQNFRRLKGLPLTIRQLMNAKPLRN